MKKTKLSLNRETVRMLSPTALAGIIGGGGSHQQTMTSCNACSTFVDTYCNGTVQTTHCPTQEGCQYTAICSGLGGC